MLRIRPDPTRPVDNSGTEVQRSLKIRAVIATVARFLCEQCGTIYTLWRSALSVSECPDVKNYKWRLNPVWHPVVLRRISIKNLTLFNFYFNPYGNSGCQRVKDETTSATEVAPFRSQRRVGVKCGCQKVIFICTHVEYISQTIDTPGRAARAAAVQSIGTCVSEQYKLPVGLTGCQVSGPRRLHRTLPSLGLLNGTGRPHMRCGMD